MGSEWENKSFGELFKVKHGFAFKGEYFTDKPTKHLLTTPGNFAIGGGFLDAKPKFYDGPVPENYILRKGDVVVTMTDLSKESDTLGNAALIPDDDNIWLHNQRVGLLEFRDVQAVDSQFICYLLRSHEYRSWIVGSATGTTVKHTSPSRISEFSCPIPPLREQRAVAHILGSLDDKIELNRRMNATLEGMAQALFKSWFVDFDPVIDNALAAGNPIPDELADRAEVRRQALADDTANREAAKHFPAAFQKNETMGWIPVGWKVSTIGEECDTVGGGTPNTNNPDFWKDGEYPWVTPKDFSTLNDKVLLSSSRFLTKKGLKKVSSGLLPVGTVLMSSRAPVGYLAITQIETAINQGFIAMICNKQLPSEYILQWANSRMEDIKQASSGSTFAEISKKAFRPFKVLVPDPDALEAYTKIAAAAYKRISDGVAANNTLTTLRDTLLPKLISGALRMSGAKLLNEEGVA